jgi:hypothetical protein
MLGFDLASPTCFGIEQGTARSTLESFNAVPPLALVLGAVDFTEKNPLLHICDLYDAALGLRVFEILYGLLH